MCMGPAAEKENQFFSVSSDLHDPESIKSRSVPGGSLQPPAVSDVSGTEEIHTGKSPGTELHAAKAACRHVPVGMWIPDFPQIPID